MPYDGFFASEGGTAWPNWGGTEWASLDSLDQQDSILPKLRISAVFASFGVYCISEVNPAGVIVLDDLFALGPHKSGTHHPQDQSHQHSSSHDVAILAPRTGQPAREVSLYRKFCGRISWIMELRHH